MSVKKNSDIVFLRFAGEQDLELLSVVLKAVAEESKDWNNTAGTPLCLKADKSGHLIVSYKSDEE